MQIQQVVHQICSVRLRAEQVESRETITTMGDAPRAVQGGSLSVCICFRLCVRTGSIPALCGAHAAGALPVVCACLRRILGAERIASRGHSLDSTTTAVVSPVHIPIPPLDITLCHVRTRQRSHILGL